MWEKTLIFYKGVYTYYIWHGVIHGAIACRDTFIEILLTAKSLLLGVAFVIDVFSPYFLIR